MHVFSQLRQIEDTFIFDSYQAVIVSSNRAENKASLAYHEGDSYEAEFMMV